MHNQKQVCSFTTNKETFEFNPNFDMVKYDGVNVATIVGAYFILYINIGYTSETLGICNQVDNKFYEYKGEYHQLEIDEFGMFREGMQRSERPVRSYR